MVPLTSEERFEHLSYLLLQRSEALIGIEGALAISNELLCLLLNILVIVAAFTNQQFRRQTYIYVVVMAVNDVVMALIPMTLACHATIKGKWDLGDGLCQLQGYMAYLCSIGTMFLFSLISVNRFFRIIHPNFYRRVFTNRFILVTAAVVWVLVSGIVASFGFTAGFIFHPGFMVCTMNHDNMDLTHLLMSVAFFSVIPFDVTLYCYFKIWRFISHHNNNMNSSAINREEIKITRIMFLALASFVFCMAPFLVVTVYEAVVGQFTLDRRVYFFCLGMRSVVGFINPLIYAALNKTFRNEFVKIFHCFFGRSRVMRIQPAPASALTNKLPQ